MTDRERVRQQLAAGITPELYARIREEWKRHSIAEDARDIPGLLSTLTEDCEYVLVQTGDVWRGHEGARAFYTELLAAFPDIDFALRNIVIGPQGVYEEAHATGTHAGTWRGRPPSGEKVAFEVVIFFPWDAEREKFRGERMYTWGY